MGFLIELVERLAGPKAVRIIYVKITLIDLQGHGVGGIGLQLDGVRTAFGGRFDDLQRSRERLVVIAGHLSDDEGGVPGADIAIGDLHSKTFGVCAAMYTAEDAAMRRIL
jgi:hypothetical protein